MPLLVHLYNTHRHLSNIDCLMVHTACLVCLIRTVNGCSKKKPWKTSANSGHITDLKQSILETFNIYDNTPASSVHNLADHWPSMTRCRWTKLKQQQNKKNVNLKFEVLPKANFSLLNPIKLFSHSLLPSH